MKDISDAKKTAVIKKKNAPLKGHGYRGVHCHITGDKTDWVREIKKKKKKKKEQNDYAVTVFPLPRKTSREYRVDFALKKSLLKIVESGDKLTKGATPHNTHDLTAF